MPRRFKRRTRRRRRRRPRRRRRRRLMLDPELKTIENVVNTPITNIGFRALLNGIPRGVENDNRIGFQHLNVSHQITYSILQVGTQTSLMRVSLVLFKEPLGVDLGVDSIWLSSGTVFAPITHRELKRQRAFRVLWTRLHRVDNGNQLVFHKKFRRLHFVTRYDDTGNGAIPNINSGALYLLAHSTIGVGNNPPEIFFTSRVRFVG